MVEVESTVRLCWAFQARLASLLQLKTQVGSKAPQGVCCLGLASACDHVLAIGSPCCPCHPCLVWLAYEAFVYHTFFACLHDQLCQPYCEQAHQNFAWVKHLHCWTPTCDQFAPACFCHSTAHRVDIETPGGCKHTASMTQLSRSSIVQNMQKMYSRKATKHKTCTPECSDFQTC